MRQARNSERRRFLGLVPWSLPVALKKISPISRPRKSELDKLRDYLRKNCLDLEYDKEYQLCQSEDVLHFVHDYDRIPTCRTCAGADVSNLKRDLAEEQRIPDVHNFLKTLKFPQLCGEYESFRLSLEGVKEANGISLDEDPILLPRGSVLLANRFNRTSGMWEQQNLYFPTAKITQGRDSAQYAQIPIREGSLGDIHRSIMAYYDKEKLGGEGYHITINGIVHVEREYYGCNVLYDGSQVFS
jgi:hypothetical protein